MMNRKRIITIAGRPGSGKSSTAKKVAQELEYKHFSTGDFFRALAKERGLTLMELNKLAETDLEVDKEIDSKSKELSNEKDFVLDSRMAFHFIPDSFRVYLDIDPNVAIKRILRDMEVNEDRKNSEEAYQDMQHAQEETFARYESENKRYKELYNADPSDYTNYDLVIDTGLTENNLETVVEKIISGYKEWLGGK